MTKPLTRAEVAALCGCKVTDIPAGNSPTFSLTRYTPAGPVCERYIRSLGPIDAITGPSGSGKTVGTIAKLVRFAAAAMPACRDGVVRCRIGVLRDNYRALYRTTLRSWFNFFPPDFPGSTFLGGQDRPAQHLLRLSSVRQIDGVYREVNVDVEVDFFAVGDVAIEELLKGYEASAFWVNEGDLLAERVIPFAYDRTGRYPSKMDLPEGVSAPRMVAVDFNPTPPKHPLWLACTRGTFQLEAPDDPLEAALMEAAKDNLPKVAINFFHQPSGLSAEAENRAGKSYQDYASAAAVMKENDVRRFVHGLPGYPTDGKPVYAKDYNRRKHLAGGPIPILPNRPIHIGFDQDLTPAAVLFQISSLGQVRFLRELFLGHGVGYQRFLSALIPILTTEPLRGLPPGNWTADPAGFYGADKIGGELAWAEAVSAGLGHPIYPAPTNELQARIEALRLKLITDIDATTPGVLIDPEGCPLLTEGLEAEYRFPKFKEGAPTAWGDQPVKNNASHVLEAAQYGILGVFGRAGIINEAAKAGRPGNVVTLPTTAMVRDRDFSGW